MNLTPADLAAWAQYERQAHRAAQQYADLPISFNRAEPAPCTTCGRETTDNDGQCRRCKKAGKRSTE